MSNVVQQRPTTVLMPIPAALAVGVAIWLAFVLIAQSAEEEQRTILAATALFSLAPVLVFLGLNPLGAEIVTKGSTATRVSLALFWLTAAAGSLGALEPLSAFAYLLGTMLAMLFCGHLWYLSAEGVERGLKLYAPLGAICLALLTLIFGFDLGERLASFRNPNGVGLLCYGCITVAFAIRSHAIKAFTLALGAAILFLTSSRTSMLGLLVAAAAYALPRWRTASMAWRIVGMVMFASAGLLVLVYYDDLWELINELLLLDDPYRGINSGFTGRDVLWEYGWQLFTDNPIWGVGFRQHELYFAMSNPSISMPGSAHNGYLAALAELGIMGSIPLFIWVGIRTAVVARADDVGLNGIAFPFVAGYLVIAIFERFLINMGNPTSLIFLMLLTRPWTMKKPRKRPKPGA